MRRSDWSGDIEKPRRLIRMLPNSGDLRLCAVRPFDDRPHSVSRTVAKSAADAQEMVHPLAIAVDARSYWIYMVSVSEALPVILLPIIGAVADYGRRVLAAGQSAIVAVLRQLVQTLRQMRRFPQTMTFLIAFLLYNHAIHAQTRAESAARVSPADGSLNCVSRAPTAQHALKPQPGG